MPRCSSADFNAGDPGGSAAAIRCPVDTRVGSALVGITLLGAPDTSDQFSGVFNMVPPRGYAAMFGFRAVQANVMVLVRLREDGDYGLTASLRRRHQQRRRRLQPPDAVGRPDRPAPQPVGDDPDPVPVEPVRLLRRTASSTGLSATSWQRGDSSRVHTEDVAAPLTGCDQLDFRPSIAVTPETTRSDSASGLTVELGVAQDVAPDRTMAAPLKDAVVTLPAGVSINPSVATGLQACTDDQFGLKALGSEGCPTASRIGSLAIDSPLLGDQLSGDVYVARQLSNDPLSGRMFRIFMQASGSGVTDQARGRRQSRPAHRPADDELPRQPAAAVLAPETGVQGRRPRPLRDPGAVRPGDDQRGARRVGREAVDGDQLVRRQLRRRRRAVPGGAAVRAGLQRRYDHPARGRAVAVHARARAG